MTEQVEKKKLPWPSRLADWSFKCSKWGLFCVGLGVISFFIASIFDASTSGAITGYVMIPFFICLVLFLIGLIGAMVLSFISLVGISFYCFKIPGAGRAAGIFIATATVFIGLCILLHWSWIQLIQTTCESNMRELNYALYYYREEKGCWPEKENWNDLIKPYLAEEERLFQCPKDKIGPCSYAMNENMPDDVNDLPSDLVILFESGPGWNAVGGVDDVVTDRHKKAGAHIAFADGRVEFVEAEEIPNLRWMVEAGKSKIPTTKPQTKSNH